MNYRVWAIRAGGDSEADPLFVENGLLAVGFQNGNRDVSALPAQRAAFKEMFAFADSGASQSSIAVLAGQLFRFVHEMKIGDRIVYPRKLDRTLLWGELCTPYLYDRSANPDFPHRRGVRWLKSLGRHDFSQGALYELASTLTLFEIRNFTEEFVARFEPSGNAAEKPAFLAEDETQALVVRDIAETIKDFIAKKLRTELKGLPMEPFIADLFRAMGYKAHATKTSHDDGVDVIAHRDELGIEPPILKIQVKAHEGNIGADLVKAFYAMIHERDVGIFITIGGFTAAARDFSRTKANFKLLDGGELVDLIEKYYDGLDLKYRKLIPLRRLLAPDVSQDD